MQLQTQTVRSSELKNQQDCKEGTPKCITEHKIYQYNLHFQYILTVCV